MYVYSYNYVQGELEGEYMSFETDEVRENIK
jgi:hypothetical protein